MNRGRMVWTHTGRTVCEDKGRYCIFTSQKWSAHHQKLGERHRTDRPLQLPEGTDTVNTLILDF